MGKHAFWPNVPVPSQKAPPRQSHDRGQAGLFETVGHANATGVTNAAEQQNHEQNRHHISTCSNRTEQASKDALPTGKIICSTKTTRTRLHAPLSDRISPKRRDGRRGGAADLNNLISQ